VRRQEPRLWGAGAFLLALALWEGCVRAALARTTFLPPPSAVLGAAWGLYATGEMWSHLGASGIAFAAGLGIAVGLGVPAAFAIGWSPRLEAILAPFFSGLYATPKLALLPIVIIWIGISLWSVAFVVFLTAFFPIVINLSTGVKTADAALIRVARSFQAGRLWMFWTIVLPWSVPFFLAGLRLAVIGGLVAIVVGEMYASRAGIGYLVAVTGATLQVTKMFAAVLVLTVCGLLFVLTIELLERRVERWRPPRHP
jgi:NitT/TauT family transport system permease protein